MICTNKITKTNKNKSEVTQKIEEIPKNMEKSPAHNGPKTWPIRAAPPVIP